MSSKTYRGRRAEEDGVPGPPPWAARLLARRSSSWTEVEPGFRVRRLEADGIALGSVVCRGAETLAAADFARSTVRAYRLLGEQLDRGDAAHLVRVWNFIPGILQALGELPQRYMVFNAGRFSAYRELYRDRGRFEHQIATASGVGHQGSDLVIHGLAAASPGSAVENPRQVPSYRYSARYGPVPPCFARATRVLLDPSGRPWLLVGGTASVRGEATVFAGDVGAQTEETLRNLASVVAAGLNGDGGGRSAADLLARYRYLRAYVVREELGPQIARRIADRCPRAEVELVRADLCRPDLLIEVEGVADLGPDRGGFGARE